MLKKITLFMTIIAAAWGCIHCDTAGVTRLDDGRSRYASDGRKLSGTMVIEGNVIDAGTKKGIKNAKVEMKNANMGVGYYTRETDGSGYFKIDDFIPYVRYSVEVTAQGYVTYTSTGALTGRQTIALAPESRLTGTVKTRNGEPLHGVEVKLTTYDESGGEGEGPGIRKPLVAATDSNGSYRFDKLSAGSYSVMFTMPGFITETAQLQKIKEGETFSLPMVMTRPASVTGTVAIEGTGSPAINVDVSMEGNVTHSTTTFQDGTYRLEDVKPGTYKMTVTHQGFYELTPHAIKVNEGDKLQNVNFSVKAKEPQVQVYAYRYTFAPGDTIEFNIRSLRLESLKATIYRVPIDILVRGGVDADRIDPAEEKFKAVLSWDEPIREFEPYEWRYQSLQVKTALPTGGYCVEVKGAGRVISRKFFSLTTVGVVMKRSQGSVFAYATNLVDNTPIADARIAVFDTTPQKKKDKKTTYEPPDQVEDLSVKVMLQGKTDENGIYHKKFESDRYLSAIVIAKDGSYAICNTGSPSSFEKEQKKYFIYTDRPVYRAGDSVYYKIIGKNREQRFVPVAGGHIYYKILNRDMDKTVGEGEMTLDEWGTADGKLTLSREANLGMHEIMAGPSVKNLYGRGRFYVEQYRKPEFIIKITPAKDYFINGDMAEFKVDSKYFFGAPLKGALVKYRFYETRLRDTDTTYWWEQDYGAGGSYNRIVLEGEKYADDEGIAVLRLHAGNFPYDREITCEATVVDRSNVSITSSNKVRVGRGEYYIKIEPAQHFFAAGEKKTVAVKTLTQTGKPVSAGIKVELFRYIWKPWERVYVHDSRPLFSEKVTTDSKGTALVDLPKQFSLYGEFDMVVSGVDSRSNTITASRVIWIYSADGAQVASRFKNLEISLNETEMTKPGEVTCLVKSRFTDSYVCLTLEGRDVYESKVVRMTGNILPIKFNIKGEYAPNLYVTATMQRKRALYTASSGIALPVHDTELAISIEPDRQKYRPGETAGATLKAVDGSGRPVRADLSIAAVDEAVFQVRYDHTPLMKDFFYTKISNWVLTSYSYPVTMLAGAAKDGGAVKVREKFEDTAFWSAKIRTDEDGTARVKFTLPDNLTTWRLTARGHDRAGRVGEKRSTFLVTQDLIARIGKPRFMVGGDKLDLIGIVNSNTERGLKQVTTEFKAGAKDLEPEEKISISLPAFGSSRNYYPYRVPDDAREVTLQYTARADKDAADALKLTVPVERRGTPYKLFGIGDMAENKTVIISPLTETDDFTFTPESVTISLNPSPIVQMLRATKFLSEYPYGCIEQTLNSFIPNLALQRMLRQKGYAGFINDKAKKNLDDKAGAGLARIQQYQNDDGTWGWWSGSRGNAYVTGYVLHSLNIALKSGYAVDKERVKRGQDAIARYFKNPQIEEWDAIAYLLYINALWGRWDHEIFKKIMKAGDAGPYRLACLMRALSLARTQEKLSEEIKNDINTALPGIRESILALEKKDGRGIYWESRGRERWGWQGGNAEITAHVLSALVESGDRSALPAQIVRSLCNRGRGDAWNSTKETATIMLALCGYIETTGAEAVTKGEVRFDMDGAKLVDMPFDLGKAGDPEIFTRKIPLAGGAPRSMFNVTAGGTAGTDLGFQVTIAGTLNFKDKGLSLLKTEERGISALSNGIKITRTFASITRVRDSHNNEYMVPQSFDGKKEIHVGDEVLVKVKFMAQDDFQYLVLEDFLPSGFEVTRNSAYDEYQPYVHIERWDNRMVYFFTDLKKNEAYEVAYIIRAELPGTFMARPSRMECMYEPTIQGWAAPAVIDVKKK
jgi:alpha-2-macroglobulin